MKKSNNKKKAKSKQKQKQSWTDNDVPQGEDIVDLILADHKILKKLIKVMKDSDATVHERRRAFNEFAPALLAHAKPEERTWYLYMKGDKELRQDGMEGDVEHSLAEQLVEDVHDTIDKDLWGAKVKVLAELVEHHIEEEEDEMLPKFKKEAEDEERMRLGEDYRQLKREFENGELDERMPGRAPGVSMLINGMPR